MADKSKICRVCQNAMFLEPDLVCELTDKPTEATDTCDKYRFCPTRATNYLHIIKQYPKQKQE